MLTNFTKRVFAVPILISKLIFCLPVLSVTPHPYFLILYLVGMEGIEPSPGVYESNAYLCCMSFYQVTERVYFYSTPFAKVFTFISGMSSYYLKSPT